MMVGVDFGKLGVNDVPACVVVVEVPVVLADDVEDGAVGGDDVELLAAVVGVAVPECEDALVLVVDWLAFR